MDMDAKRRKLGAGKFERRPPRARRIEEDEEDEDEDRLEVEDPRFASDKDSSEVCFCEEIVKSANGSSQRRATRKSPRTKRMKRRRTTRTRTRTTNPRQSPRQSPR